MGFLALSNADPHNSQWVDAARHTAGWLTAVSKQDGKGGRYWPDYADDQEVSEDIYTSFDDGTIGIGDFFWQLYEKTKDPQYKQIATESVMWTLSQAEPYNQNGVNAYRWRWNASDPNSPYYMGMGEGAAGITYSLASFSQRLAHTDPSLAARCNIYVQGSLNYIDSVRHSLANNTGISQAIPETGVIGQDGDSVINSGYLSGAAGYAFMNLNLYKIYGDKQYLDRATITLDWLGNSEQGPMVKVGRDASTWKLALDPQGGNDNHYATGFEEGDAGIGWTYLQAYNLTGNKAYLQTAESAANWLLAVAVKGPNGSVAWHEDEHPTNRLIHANLDNGAAGIGQFLWDVYQATGNQKYKITSQSALQGLKSSAKFNGRDIYWQDNGGNDPYSNDPSWHWGLAGIIEFTQRINGGSQDILGEQPGLAKTK